MNNETVKANLDHADQLLQAAQNHMCRPAEDVVPQLVINNVRESMKNYFTGFLLQNRIVTDPDSSLDTLLNQCQKIDSGFENLNLAGAACLHSGQAFSNSSDIKELEKCMQLANEAKAMVNEAKAKVSKSTWPISKPIK